LIVKDQPAFFIALKHMLQQYLKKLWCIL